MALVERPLQVKVEFENINGDKHNMLLMGLMSRIFQHEIDHLDGELMWLEN